MRSFSCLMLAAALAAGVLHGRPSACQEAGESPKEEAKKYFDRAVLLFNAGDIEGALDNFLASYEARPHEKLKLNIGLCLYKLGRYAEAGNALNDFLLAEAQDSPKNILEETKDILDEIKKKAGIIQVEVDGKSAGVKIDAENLGHSPVPWTIFVEPGEHELAIETPEGQSWSGKVKIKAGETRVVSLTLAADKAAVMETEWTSSEETPAAGSAAPGRGKKAARDIFIASLALAAASAIAGAASGGVALQKAGDMDDLDKDCRDSGCEDDEALHADYLEKRQDLYDSAELAGQASTGLLAAAGVFAVASLASLLVWKLHKKEKPLRAAPVLLPSGGGGLVLGLEF